MRAPANPDVRLAVGHVDQSGEGERLQGNGEFADDFDRLPTESVVKKSADQILHSSDDLGLFGAVEKRFGQLAVAGV